jgi:nucleotide-binding universal stress UspA family protein
MNVSMLGRPHPAVSRHETGDTSARAAVSGAGSRHTAESNMEYKTILVHVDRSTRLGERLEVALRLAERFGAHLTGLYALSALRVPAYALTASAETLLEATERQRAESLRQAKEVFDAACKRYMGIAAEWRVSEEDALEAVRLSARYSDLVVVGQHDPYAERDSGTHEKFVEELALSASRPVLIVPYAGHFPNPGKRILIAWNASPQAARAVTAALPILQQAEEVRIAVFDPDKRHGQHGDVPGADLALQLARHGVKALVTEQGSPNGDVGCGILSRAADFGSDMIVMGAYSHSRARERVLGGATRTLLSSMTVPVLTVH